MAYAQWVVIKISNSCKKSIKIVNVKLGYGKFHKAGNMDEEIKADDIDGTEIAPNSDVRIYACGRSDSPSGTDGAMQLAQEQTEVCTLYWNCPWGTKSNNFEVQGRNKDYVVSAEGWQRGAGALGTVEVEVFKKG